MITIGDIDIDVFDRNLILKELPHIPAYRKESKDKHPTGVYVQDIEFDPLTGYATVDFRDDDDLLKVDFINFSAVGKFISNKQIETLIDIDPDWSLLKDKEFVEKLPHIHKWFDFLQKREVKSVDQLAMFLALIRPGKDHLKYKPWSEVEATVWDNTGTKYFFKKSHAYSYALTIVALMNLHSGY